MHSHTGAWEREIAGFDRRLVRFEVMNALILAGVVSLVIKTFFT